MVSCSILGMMDIFEMETVKVCKKCGPLSESQVYRVKDMTWLDCKACRTEKRQLLRLADPEKYKARREKYKFFDRDPSIEKMRCVTCKSEKKLLEFNESMLRMRYPVCRVCNRIRVKEHHARPESKEKHKQWYNKTYKPIARNSYYLKKYGITLEQYDELFRNQQGKCKICLGPPTRKVGKFDNFDVDHDHISGKVRGLLCSKCNIGIGYFQDSKELLKKALLYLEEQ
jgi:hypothetical protein